MVHNWIAHFTHLQIPVEQAGSFNLFAWQAIWIVGLWLGARSAFHQPILRKVPAWATACCCLVCLFFIGVRYSWLGPHLTQQALGIQLDKWQLGPLRVLNEVSFAVILYWMRKYLLRWVAIEPFLTLGKASLHVFCTHIVFVFIGLAFLVRDVGQDVDAPAEQLHGVPAAILLLVTFTGLILVAIREVRRRRFRREPPSQGKPPDVPPNSESGDPAGCPQLAQTDSAAVEA